MREEFLHYRMLMVYINEAQKARLEEFFDEIGFYLYGIHRKVETVWSDKLKHKNCNTWPGTDCIFLLTVPEQYVDEMLSYLKTFRMSLPSGIAMSVGILPMERVIPRLYVEDLPVKEDLLEKLKKKHKN